MNGTDLKQRLVAILAADAVGYSRLMAVDERGTVAALVAARTVIRAQVESNQGRVIDTAGDSVLAVFETATGAVNAALLVQKTLAESGQNVPEDRRMRFRIGLNLGDVIEKADGTVYGDGVNVAARLQALAEPGGISVSESIRTAVKGRVAATFEDLGEQTVKNIAEPVRTYRVNLEEGPPSGFSAARAQSDLPLPVKPSIAVLPFSNMSGDPEQDYFADGMVEDIITALSRYSELFVIARNSSFTYKGRAVRVQDVRRELGVHYVVEGSVRRIGNRVRVTVQLIDSVTGAHIWAERYDREIVDVFELQDELTQAIVATLPGRLGGAEAERVRRKPPRDMAALDYLIAGKIHHHRVTRTDNERALHLLDRAIELDPHYAQAYAWKACTLGQAMEHGFRTPAEVVGAQAVDALNKALALDDNDVECHRLLCEVCIETQRVDEAVVHNQRALSLNPNDPRIVAQKGELLTWLGRPREGIEWLRKAMRLDPHGAHGRVHLLGRALFGSRNYEEAILAFKQVRALRYDHHLYLAGCYAQLERDPEARTHVAAALRLKPGLSIGKYVQKLPYRESADRNHLEEALRKADLPEQ